MQKKQAGVAYPDWVCELARRRGLPPETRLGQAFMAGYVDNHRHGVDTAPDQADRPPLLPEGVRVAAREQGFVSEAQLGAYEMGYQEKTPFRAPILVPSE